MANYLVTGGAGFIGSHIARRLLELGNKVAIIDNLSSGYQENVPDGAELIVADLRDPLEFDGDFDAVLHLAAQVSAAVSCDKPRYDLENNLLATIHLLSWCEKNKIGKFIFASSMGVYGRCALVEAPENGPCFPQAYYGIHKLAAEGYVRLYKGDWTIFRMFNVYGPGQDLANRRQGMVSIYLSYMLEHEPVIVKGGLGRYRDFIYIDDVVDAWVEALDNPRSNRGIYNLASGNRTHIRELLSALTKAFGNEDYPRKVEGGTLGDQYGALASIGHIKADFDWRPKISLEEGIRRTVEDSRARLQLQGI